VSLAASEKELLPGKQKQKYKNLKDKNKVFIVFRFVLEPRGFVDILYEKSFNYFLTEMFII
jgi:hypothetical protein